MTDDTTKKRPQDSAQINIHEDYEVRYWTNALGVTSAKLKEAVKKVGPMIADVRKELAKK